MNTLFLYVHILSAVLSIGPLAVLLPLLRQMRHSAEAVLQEQLKLFRSAIRLIKHAGHVLVTSGVLLLWAGPFSWRSSWVLLTLAVMAGSIVFLARAFKPVLRRFDDPGQNRQILVSALVRSVWLYISLLLLMLWFMVAKPVLW